MNEITMMMPIRVAPDVELLPAYVPLPGFGVLPVNAFLIRAAEPVLVDAGVGVLREVFMTRLRKLIDVAEIRWLWLTHTDPDHIGSLEAVLAEAPQAKVVTTYLAVGKMSLHRPLPLERVYLLNPGQRLDVGDRQLLALRPPSFDSPETVALFDTRTRALFSADSFGALLKAPADAAEAIPAEELSEGLRLWATVDSPWLAWVEAASFGRALESVRHLQPNLVLSGHLPPARGITEVLLSHLDEARRMPLFVGPDQAGLVQPLAAE